MTLIVFIITCLQKNLLIDYYFVKTLYLYQKYLFIATKFPLNYK